MWHWCVLALSMIVAQQRHTEHNRTQTTNSDFDSFRNNVERRGKKKHQKCFYITYNPHNHTHPPHLPTTTHKKKLTKKKKKKRKFDFALTAFKIHLKIN